MEDALNSVVQASLEQAEQGGLKTPSDFNLPNLDVEVVTKLQQQASIEAIYPATSLQQGFIYHHISQPQDDAYRVQILLDYAIELDVSAFKQAWQLAAKQFPALRTAFNWESEPVQVIYQDSGFGNEHFDLVDISHLDDIGRSHAIEQLHASQRQTAFDLTQPGLLRIVVIKQSEQLYTVLKTEHHSIGDGWSSPVLWHAVHEYYDQLVQGNSSEKLAQVIQPDQAYFATQRYYQQQKSATEAYWAERRGRYPSANDVSAMLTHKVDLAQVKEVPDPVSQVLHFGGEGYAQLKQMCQREGITINVATQFAWHKLIQSYSADRETVVGTTVSGRDLPVDGIESSVGLFINTLPLSVGWYDDNQTIRDTLLAIQSDIAALNSHSAVSLASLQNQSERLFHSLFVFENYPKPAADSDGNVQAGTNGAASIESTVRLRGAMEKVDYPLYVTAREDASGSDALQHDELVITLSYSELWLNDLDSQKLLNKLARILQAMADNPAQSCFGLNIIDEQERNQLLFDFNNTDLPFPDTKTLHGIYQEQVAKTPDNIALTFKNEQLTYAELDVRVNQLAHANTKLTMTSRCLLILLSACSLSVAWKW